MSNIEKFLSTDDWVDLNRKINKEDDIENLPNREFNLFAITMLHSAIRELFSGPEIQTTFEIINKENVCLTSDLKEIQFVVSNKEILDGENYENTLNWFFEDDDSKICSLEMFCNILNIDSKLIKEKVQWIHERRSKIIKKLTKNFRYKDKMICFLRISREEIQKNLKKNYLSGSQYAKFSKTMSVKAVLKQAYKNEFESD